MARITLCPNCSSELRLWFKDAVWRSYPLLPDGRPDFTQTSDDYDTDDVLAAQYECVKCDFVLVAELGEL